MIVHIIPTEKFTLDFIERINYLFASSEHYFLIHGSDNVEYKLDQALEYENCSYSKELRNNQLLSKEDNIELIILHSMFLKTVDLRYLYNLLKKKKTYFAWAIWGADLYNDYRYAHSIKTCIKIKPLIKEYYRKKLIKNIDIFITGTDYDFLLKHYSTKSIHSCICARYSYNFLPITNSFHSSINVMVGHSATPTCRHIETFNLLRKYSNDIDVYCPLSYPRNDKYIKQVCDVGNKIFGEHFHPIVDFMDYNKYIDFLNTMDIGVFNNNRQQGMGNITNLLYLGKKVYLSSDNTINLLYPKDQYTIFDTSEITNTSFLDRLTADQAESNKEKVLYQFSDENFKKEWNEVFTYGKKE